jgi:hypothetical protein
MTDDSMTAATRDRALLDLISTSSLLPSRFFLSFCHSSCSLRAESMRSQMTGRLSRSDTLCHSVTLDQGIAFSGDIDVRIVTVNGLNLRACLDFFRLPFLA